MLHLISGASRSGKSIIARKLLAEHGLPYLSLDWLMMGFNDGIPEYGIHHLLWPDDIARKMWPFFSGMTDNMIFANLDYVIEGEAMLPELVAGLMRKYPGKVKAAFCGYADAGVSEKVALVKRYSAGEDDWLTRKSDDYIRDHIQNMIEYSARIKRQCAEHDVAYFDTAGDFGQAAQGVVSYFATDLR